MVVSNDAIYIFKTLENIEITIDIINISNLINYK